ncbi:MAG: YiiX family permuted papain-like enzyme [Bacteroidota bacterium]
MRKVFIIVLALLASGVVTSTFTNFESFKKKNTLELKEGDLIFQSSNAGQSRAIQLATHSKYSHVGMLIKENNEWMVLEAIQPVCISPLNQWIQRGDREHFVIKRLKNHQTVLSPKTINDMKSFGKSFLGKNYDIYFEWSDDQIYCSELIWKIYNKTTGLELGELQPLKEFDFSHPIVQSIAAQRYGVTIPENEMAISPGAMFNSELLQTVISKNDF